MPTSVVEPVSPAIERTRKILFRPFDLGKWFVLGFCAFLAHLGEGGVGFNPGGGGGPGGGGPGGGQGGGDFAEFRAWVLDHLATIVLIAVAVVAILLLLGLVVTWLSSRGKFMFLDGVVHNRGAVVEPWREFKREGNSLFWFRVAFGLATLAAMLLTAGVGVALAWPDIQAERFGGAAVTGLVTGTGLLLLVGIISGVIDLFLADFVVPVMYLRRLRVLQAWGVFRQELLAGHGGTFVLYVLFKMVIGLCLGFIGAFATCCTCCVAVIPYLGSVILLPLLVFNRAYSLYFLEQFGPEWRFFPRRRRWIRDDEEGLDDWPRVDEDWPPGEDEAEPPDEDERPPDDRVLPG